MDTTLRDLERQYQQTPIDADVCAKYEAALTRLAYTGNVDAILQLQALLFQLEENGEEAARERLITLFDAVLEREPESPSANAVTWTPDRPADAYTNDEVRQLPVFAPIQQSIGGPDVSFLPETVILGLCRDVIRQMHESIIQEKQKRLVYDDEAGWELVAPAKEQEEQVAVEGFDLFNSLSGSIGVGEDRSGCKCPNCYCSRVIDEISWSPYLWEGEGDERVTRELTDEERQQVAITEPTISVASEAGISVTHQAPNNQHFTIGDLIQVVIETERQTRGRDISWFDGVDRHHTFFEGMALLNDGSYHLNWGS
jgi:hypothetical protein